MDLKPYDPENTPLEGTMLLEASAGTGKTYALERMVARLVGRRKAPLLIDEILVVTFTNRAAREMKHRIRGILVDRALESHRKDEERARYRRALLSFDQAAIYTIHGFCRMVLSTWPFESGVPFRQDLVPGGQLETREVRSWLAGLNQFDIDNRPLAAAYQAAGSVESLVAAIVGNITGEGIPPGARVMPSTEESQAFANRTVSSLQEDDELSRASDALFSRDWLDDDIKAVFKATGGPRKTASSLKKIRTHMNACRGVRGLVELSQVLFESDLDTGNHLAELLGAGFLYRRDTPGDLKEDALAQALVGLIEALEPYVEIKTTGGKCIMSGLVSRYLEHAFSDLAGREVSKRVEEVKDQEGLWGYSDLVRRVADAVEKDLSPLRDLLRRRYQAALIDEFQDTDPRQWRLFKTLYDIPSHILALIGDPKQSIYGFRGTGLQTYSQARLSVPEARRFRLDTNYRSCGGLVNLANRLFAPLFLRSADGGEPVGFEPVRQGTTSVGRLDSDDASIPLTLLGVESESEAPGVIAAEIRSLLDPVTVVRWVGGKRDGEPVEASDIAVLVRNFRQEDEMLAHLRDLGIPALAVRSSSVFHQPIVPWLLALLETMDTPRNLSLWRAVFLGEFFRLPPDLLVQFENEDRLDVFIEEGEKWRGMIRSGRTLDALEDFFEFSKILANWTEKAGKTTLSRRLRLPWPERILSEPNGDRSLQDWRHLGELIQEQQAEGVRDIPGLITWINNAMTQGGSEGKEDALRLETENKTVRVMTMHASKGLEFLLVFLFGGFNGKTARKSSGFYRFDDSGTLVIDRIRKEENFHRHRLYEWEEDKRLWYVAFTRASAKLWAAFPVGDGKATLIESIFDEATRESGFSDLPPHEVLQRDDIPKFRENLKNRIAAMEPEFLGWKKGNEEPQSPLPRPPMNTPSALPRLPEHPGNRDPVTGSYTSLVRSVAGDGSEDRDRDEITGSGESILEIQDTLEPIPLLEERGALFGTLLHGILEEIDQRPLKSVEQAAWLEDADVDAFFSKLAGRYYPPDWYRSKALPLKNMVWSTLRAAVPGVGRICDIEHQRPEVEFQMTTLQDAEIFLDGEGIQLQHGYLKGFIDLLVKSQDRWWVVDWKTNVPEGAFKIEDYHEATLELIMKNHRYKLQYELYLLALCRSLRPYLKRPVNWEEEIGGAAYLFIRACRENDDHGILSMKPDRGRMLELASAFGVEDILV